MNTLIDKLDYQCYKYNRQRSPDVTPDEWRVVFGDRVDKLERRFQDEISQKVSIQES